MWESRAVTLASMALGTLAALAAIFSYGPGPRDLPTGDPRDTIAPPTFELSVARLEAAGPDGRAVDLLADSRVPVVIVDLWATWCMPCRAEIPDLNLLAEELSGRASVVGVLIEGFESGRADPLVRQRIARLELRYPVYFATPETYRAVEALTGRPVTAVPTKLVLDRVGRKGYLVEGVQPMSLYRRLVRQAVKREA